MSACTGHGNAVQSVSPACSWRHRPNPCRNRPVRRPRRATAAWRPAAEREGKKQHKGAETENRTAAPARDEPGAAEKRDQPGHAETEQDKAYLGIVRPGLRLERGQARCQQAVGKAGQMKKYAQAARAVLNSDHFMTRHFLKAVCLSKESCSEIPGGCGPGALCARTSLL